MWWAFFCAVVVANGARAAIAPAPDSLPHFSPLDLVQIDSVTPDEADEFSPAASRGRYGGLPWLYNYLLTDLSHDGQINVNKKAVQDMRARRGFSVNPAVETLQRTAYNYYLGRLAHSNREFLNCVGKRDPWSGADCKTKNFLDNLPTKIDFDAPTKSDF